MNLRNPIAKGNTAEIYLCDNKVVKLFKEYFPNTESLYEAQKQKYAYSCGLHVPKVFEVTEIQGRQAIIMEYVEGESVGELLLNNLSKAEYFISICVSIQQKIHAISVNSNEIEPMEERLYRQINSVHDLDEKQKGNILKKLDSITFEPRVCHGDVNIIDWVDASSGDIRADVFRTYLLYSQNSVELAEMYLHMYCKKTGLLRDEIFQWAPIISAARLAESTPL